MKRQYSRMICCRCQRSLRNTGEGIKCADCDAKYHVACASDATKELREAGDRGYQWRCAVCLKSASRHTDPSKDNLHLITMINAISEKFELVNKIQLPKLHSDLAYIKAAVERLAVQHDDILHKIDELGVKVDAYDKWPITPNGYRRRNLHLAPRPNRSLEGNEHNTTLQSAEKSVRFRTRRRSYLLHKMLRLLNNRTQAHRRN
ncbi:hypothetical protein O3G_MSEX004473 [Manduca sexta]|uniref:PHD-type domain-containing protein n=2 Tax=Manduca sexta TaxID=7130 RepID=A0A922CI63_MANSE|nr:hypothetical protein O3G_MSEX004473 [Manduca sexta]KAG6446522.1 hypothetical protein O3G_MSEX004473 [Manduca sexta]KAG6446523.1 hypothetical protein O3G_MSEX004473 [Manduca sexta]KAG6446524.1 hypothetical protein O3G_MSEX004473 [Manduca sexta]